MMAASRRLGAFGSRAAEKLGAAQERIVAELGYAERSLGACVFALGKGIIDAEDCDLRSECGFAVWLKQRAVCRLRNCRLAAARAAVAVFNFSAVRLHACDVADANPHGICARGCARVDVEASTIRNAGVRAVYAYMSPTVTLRDVVVAVRDFPTAPISRPSASTARQDRREVQKNQVVEIKK